METPFLIDTPPPTISAGPSGPNGEPPTASLHCGHIFSYTQADLIASYHQMKGAALLYPFCFDDNGLPTEKLAQGQEIYDQNGIIRFAIDTSEKYSKLFKDIGLAFSSDAYHTISPMAQQMAGRLDDWIPRAPGGTVRITVSRTGDTASVLAHGDRPGACEDPDSWSDEDGWWLHLTWESSS